MIVLFSRISFAAVGHPINLVLYLKDLKMLVFVILEFKLFTSSLEYNDKLPVESEQFERYSNKLYIGITKFKFSASSIGVSSIFVIHLMNGAQFLNANRATVPPAIAYYLLLKCKHHCSYKD